MAVSSKYLINEPPVQVEDDGVVSYFSMIPHLIDDSSLSAHAIRLYLHLKRVSGEQGKCWQTQFWLQEACHMSNRTIVKAKRELIQAGFIKVELRMHDHHPGHLITIVNLWKENEKVYRCKTALDTGVKQHLTSVQNDTSKNTPSKNTPLRIPRVSRNPDLACMQEYFGFPAETDKDPVPNPGMEAKYIKKMKDRGFAWPQIWKLWLEKVKARGVFVSMRWVNEDIGKGEGIGTHRRDTQEADDQLRRSIGAPIGKL